MSEDFLQKTQHINKVLNQLDSQQISLTRGARAVSTLPLLRVMEQMMSNSNVPSWTSETVFLYNCSHWSCWLHIFEMLPVWFSDVVCCHLSWHLWGVIWHIWLLRCQLWVLEALAASSIFRSTPPCAPNHHSLEAWTRCWQLHSGCWQHWQLK